MKVYEIQKFGIDDLAVVDRDQPVPKAGEVLVRFHAASLNYRDIMVVTGTYNPKMKLPAVPLSDGAGEVVCREFRGHDVFYRVRLTDGTTVCSQRPSNETIPLGSRVAVRPHAGRVALFH